MLQNNFLNLFKSIRPILNDGSIRCMSRVKNRFTMPPFWHPKKTRVLYPEHVTSDNQMFLQEHIENKYSSPLRDVFEREPWTPRSYRCGLITRKIGVYPMWLKNGKRLATTLLQVSDNHVIRYIPPEELKNQDHYYKRRVQSKTATFAALIVGADSTDPREFTKEYFTLFENAGVMPKKRLAKFYITPNAKLPPGMPLHASHFRPGDYVDCTGISIDRGFQGVMKRWGFKGGRASHGVTKSHRRGGNIGGGGGAKNRVWPGTKMPGHMGRHKRTFRGGMVLRVNTKYNVIWVLGKSIPGETGNYVIVYDSIFPHRAKTEDSKDYFPTYFPGDEPLAENLYFDNVHDFSQPSITFAET